MSSRGFAGAAKPRPINVNSVYQGRNPVSGGRAAGPLGKNVLQTIGKPASIVRRMPPPATLPSLKAEHGIDSVNLVAQSGGQGWNKSIDGANDTKNQSADNSSIPLGAPDLRPTWAKNSSGGNGSLDSPAAPIQPQLQRKPGQISMASAAANNREFPTLSASLAIANKQQTTVVTQVNVVESQKTQKQIRQEGTPTGLENQEEPIIPVPPPPASNSSYIGATVRNDVNRKLPDRYYGGVSETRPNTQRRYDVRQKLAQLSMESKESPSEKTNSQSTDRQSSVPAVVEQSVSATESQVKSASQKFQPPQLSSAPPPLMQKEPIQSRGPETRSQDVRQYYQHSGQPMPPAQPLNELPNMAEWNAGNYENEYPPAHHGYRNDVPSPNVPQPQLHGRGDSGPTYRAQAGNQPIRGPVRQGGTQHPSTQQRQRYEYVNDEHPPPLMSQRFGSANASWEEYSGTQNWNDEGQRRSTNRYRGDSRGNSESESGWYASQQPPNSAPHQRRNDPNGWNYSVNEYDNYHRGQTAPIANRSRTTSNSYGEEFEPSIYYAGDNERRYKSRPKQQIVEGPQNYDYEYPEEFERQKYHDYEMQQQPTYRMLKRNDEKSAEYFSNQGATADSEKVDDEALTLSQLTRVGRTSKPLNFGSINSDSADVASSDTFDSSLEQRKTPQQVPQKFNRAPGSGKNQNERQEMTPQQYSTQKANISPAENVWKKRMEEHQLKQQEDKVTWQHIKQHRKFDYHFPAISDKKPDSSSDEPEPSIQPSTTHSTHPVRSQHKQPLQRNSSANQKAPTKWDDQQSWNEKASSDTKTEDDTYEGTRREFFNRQHASKTQNASNASSIQTTQSAPNVPIVPNPRVQKRPIVQEVVDPQPRAAQPLRRKRNEPEDTFSNMGEFHAEDYKIEEARAPMKSRFDNGFEGKGEDRGGRQNLSRKTMNSSDERNRQLKPQRATGTRTSWQRQPPIKSIVEESVIENESHLDAEGQHSNQRSSNPRNQRTNPTGSQPRSQQQPIRRNNRNGKALTPQAGEQTSGKHIKSPARSENGVDEWETASESSGKRPDTTRKIPQTRPAKNKEKTPRETNGNTKSTEGQQSTTQNTQRSNAVQKNEKPASHTFQNREEFVKNRSELNSQPHHHKNTNEASRYARNSLSSKSKNDYFKTKARDGLVGIDINDASVVIIDQTPNIGFDSNNSDNGEFEEVISRKVKRQRQAQKEQEEERAIRERQKLEQRQRLREEKQRKSTKKHSTSTNTSKQSPNEKFVEEVINDVIPKQLSSSLSPLSASDSGVAAISSTSPPQLDADQSSLQGLINVSIPAQHPVWNSPSPQVEKPIKVPDEEPEPPKTTAVGPIARPKQRNDVKVKSDLHEIPVFAKKGHESSNYSFGYEHPMCDEHDDLQEKLANIKGIWPGEADAYIGSNIGSNLFNQPIKSTQNIDPKDEVSKNVAVERELGILNEESGRSKSRSSVNRQFSSNSQSPLNTSTAFFNTHSNSIYPQTNTTHYNSISTYSMLLSETNGRDFLNGPAFGPPHTSSPPASQAFGNRSLGTFANPTKVYVAGSTSDWPSNNSELLNTINSSSPIQLQNNAFNTVTSPMNLPPPCFTTIPPPPKFQPVQPMPLNHSIPPPPIGQNFPDFRFPPPSALRSNFNSGNVRNPNTSHPPPPISNGSRSTQQRRSSHTSNGRQTSSPAPLFVHLWNSNNQQQPFGLF